MALLFVVRNRWRRSRLPWRIVICVTLVSRAPCLHGAIKGVMVLLRLDREVANKEWCEVFNIADVVVMEVISLDHKPLLVSFSKKNYDRGRRKKIFKFEVSWTTDEECNEKIKMAWRQMVPGENSLGRAQQKLDNYQKQLSRWSSKNLEDQA